MGDPRRGKIERIKASRLNKGYGECSSAWVKLYLGIAIGGARYPTSEQDHETLVTGRTDSPDGIGGAEGRSQCLFTGLWAGRREREAEEGEGKSRAGAPKGEK